MTINRASLILFLPFIGIGLAGYYSAKNDPEATRILLEKTRNLSTDETTLARIREKAEKMTKYTANSNCDNRYCFLVDMRLPSGSNRFFVYNLESGIIEKTGLVAHGSGSDRVVEELYFSNTPNSNCTSLGKYKIGKSYYGRFGLAYKLYGLEESNNKAFERFVVLHGHECVPENPIDPAPLCLSWGCPTVAPAFLLDLKKYLDDADKPIILWIYY